MSSNTMEPEPLKPGRQRFMLRRLLIASVCLLLIGSGIGLYLRHAAVNGPVPRDIQQSVPFKLYYPSDSGMPAGYSLDKTSFRLAEAGVVLFSVSYGNGSSIIFSEEAKPSSDVIDKFHASAIPVHTQVTTLLGKAVVGAYGSGKDLHTIVSLPINNGPWLIITAPSDIKHDDLTVVLQALRR